MEKISLFSAAMKTANLDRIFGWRLSQEFDENSRRAKQPLDEDSPLNSSRHHSPFYFADVCAGPGGFSEYMLWRKAFYNAKGFGFTLAGKIIYVVVLKKPYRERRF